VEVVKGAAASLAPGTEAWWRAAVRKAVYALRHRGPVQYVGEVVSWTGLLKKAVFISSSGLTHLSPASSRSPASYTSRCISQPSLVHRRRLLHVALLNADVFRQAGELPLYLLQKTLHSAPAGRYNAAPRGASTLNAPRRAGRRLSSAGDCRLAYVCLGRLFQPVARRYAFKLPLRPGRGPLCT
jgi:hypothetical protein